MVVEGLQRRARDPVTGKNELIPSDMTYREGEKKYNKPLQEAKKMVQ